MTKYVEKQLFREGILKPGPFTQNYILRCYKPSSILSDFVEHYFISRRRRSYDPTYTGNDVLSQPVVSMFFKPGEAYIEGPTTNARSLNAKDSPIYVGAQFKPGGFYPFWLRPLSQLAESRIPATSLFPRADDLFVSHLLSNMDNQNILSSIEDLLMTKQPQPDPNIGLVNKLIYDIENSKGLLTVSDLAGSFNVSERSLQHLFQTYVGVGAKWAIMRVRFLEVIKFARKQPKPNWTAIAAEFGYSDQSHFTNDFKRLLGKAPSRYMHNLTN